MNHQPELKARSTQLHHRKAHLNRAVVGPLNEPGDTGPDDSPTTVKGLTPTPSTTSVLQATLPASTSKLIQITPLVPTPTLTFSLLNPATSSTLATSLSTTLSTSSSLPTSSSKTSSTTSTLSTSSANTHSTAISVDTSIDTSIDTSRASRTVAATVTRTSSTSGTATAAISSSSANSSSGGVSAGSIVGAIFGTIGGILVVAIIVAFIVRRIRSRRNEEEHFDAAHFRRSAALLDDEFGNDNLSARPPTMIARHMAHSPAIPSASYGNYPGADRYAGGDPYPIAGGDPFTPQYAQYPAYTQEPVYGLNPGDTYMQNNPITPSMSAHEMDETAHNTYLNRQPTLRGPDAYPAVPQQYMDMNRVPSPPSTEYATGLTSPSSATPFKNPHDSHYAPVEYPSVAPVHQRADAPGFTRPETVYDADDAYGGM
ncbi:hypothetical protein D9757_006685 [Collybiopsis confluens]|uniref:Uncharacterized protein n=1 Tax=Collybiopsis confluens TaxID=2823264 RepID=A0A8H5MA32_9AGAR|nr:hypothetical protein D9757_006685 [Collybiopsis confluens]